MTKLRAACPEPSFCEANLSPSMARVPSRPLVAITCSDLVGYDGGMSLLPRKANPPG